MIYQHFLQTLWFEEELKGVTNWLACMTEENHFIGERIHISQILIRDAWITLDMSQWMFQMGARKLIPTPFSVSKRVSGEGLRGASILALRFWPNKPDRNTRSGMSETYHLDFRPRDSPWERLKQT